LSAFIGAKREEFCCLRGAVAARSTDAEKIFGRTIKRFERDIPRMHGKSLTLRCIIALDPVAAPRPAANFLPSHSDKGVAIVDLALKLNVLAVGAVFVFVGAILLGAF
jgi:hypothetical protein